MKAKYINLLVRFKNPVFLLTFIPAVIAFVYSLLSMFGVVPSIAEDTLTNNITTLITALTALGVLVDPTTKGISDSDKALTYTEPK